MAHALRCRIGRACVWDRRVKNIFLMRLTSCARKLENLSQTARPASRLVRGRITENVPPTYQSVLHFVFEHIGDDKIHIGLDHHIRYDDIKVVGEFPQNEVVGVHDDVAVGDGFEVAVAERFQEVNVVAAHILHGDEGCGVQRNVDAGKRVREVRIAIRGDGYANR